MRLPLMRCPPCILAHVALTFATLAIGSGCGPREAPFLWGTGTAAYQIETGLRGTDWAQWETMGRIHSGDSAEDGPDFLAHVDEDLAQAKALGHNAFRFSIEWARVEPAPDQYDEEGLRAYDRVLEACKRNGLAPMVTLSHFTLPTWLHDVADPDTAKKGWAGGGAAPGDGEIVARFERFAGDMAERFGDRVDLWVPLNEPIVQLVATYVNPGEERFPKPEGVGNPEKLLDLRTAMHAMTNFIFAHARAYDAIHARDRVDADGDGDAARVGIAQHMRHMRPAAAARDAEVAAARAEYAFNFLFVDAITRGDLDVTLDGRFTETGEGTALEALRDRLDFLGINYYSSSEVSAAAYPDRAPYSDAPLVLRFLAGETTSSDLPKTDLGWDIWPEGLHAVLMAAHARYGLPMYITENGLADADDSRRPGFLIDHLEAVERARKDGADVRGYLHWSLVDNFEWTRGFAPRFGLLRIDYADPRRARTVTRSAELYRDIIRAGGVTAEIRERR